MNFLTWTEGFISNDNCVGSRGGASACSSCWKCRVLPIATDFSSITTESKYIFIFNSFLSHENRDYRAYYHFLTDFVQNLQNYTLAEMWKIIFIRSSLQIEQTKCVNFDNIFLKLWLKWYRLSYKHGLDDVKTI